MITKKLFRTIQELQELQRLATMCPSGIGLHALDGKTIVDAKSYIGMYSLDFTQPILVVSEDAHFHSLIRGIGETVE